MVSIYVVFFLVLRKVHFVFFFLETNEVWRCSNKVLLRGRYSFNCLQNEKKIIFQIAFIKRTQLRTLRYIAITLENNMLRVLYPRRYLSLCNFIHKQQKGRFLWKNKNQEAKQSQMFYKYMHFIFYKNPLCYQKTADFARLYRINSQALYSR